MSEAVVMVTERLMQEEGFRAFPYDDKTDKRVSAPVGKITQGFGCNLEAGWSRGVARAVLQTQLAELVPQLNAYPWFDGLDPVRQSVLLDVAFNDGVAGLLKFKNMIAAVQEKDWTAAAAALIDSKATRDRPGRYGPLAQFLKSGGSPDV